MRNIGQVFAAAVAEHCQLKDFVQVQSKTEALEKNQLEQPTNRGINNHQCLLVTDMFLFQVLLCMSRL